MFWDILRAVIELKKSGCTKSESLFEILSIQLFEAPQHKDTFDTSREFMNNPSKGEIDLN